jgi:hypothetical protein
MLAASRFAFGAHYRRQNTSGGAARSAVHILTGRASRRAPGAAEGGPARRRRKLDPLGAALAPLPSHSSRPPSMSSPGAGSAAAAAANGRGERTNAPGASAGAIDAERALRLADSRQGVFRPGAGVLVFGAGALRSGWSSYAASVVTAASGDGFVVGVTDRRCSFSQYDCATVLSGDEFSAGALHADPRPLLRGVTGCERPVDDNAQSMIDVVLIDFTTDPNLWRLDSTGGAIVRDTGYALKAAAPLLRRDAAIVCRLPADKSCDRGSLLRGLRHVFQHCETVVSDAGSSTSLLLAKSARSKPEFEGYIARGWERSHRKELPIRQLRRKPFFAARNAKAGGALAGSAGHFVRALPSRNLEAMAPDRVKQRQLEGVRAAARQAEQDEATSAVHKEQFEARFTGADPEDNL